MGYRVVLQGPGPSTPDAFFALAGCETPTNPNARGCLEKTTTKVRVGRGQKTKVFSRFERCF